MKTKLLLTAFFITLFNSLTAQIIHVPGDQPTIQAGINVAENGDTVLVEENTYYENIDFKGKAITVGSNFILDSDTIHILNTIINGSNPAHPDSASVVKFVSGEDTTSVLSGFTITGGKGTYMEPLIFYQAGGGIFCYNSGAKIISNYIINDSIITDIQGIGAGVYAGPNGSDSWLVLKNNKINDNYIFTTTTDYFSMAPAVATECHCIILGNEIVNNTSISENHRASGAVLCRGMQSPRFSDISGNIISNNSTFSYADIESRVFAGALYILFNYGNISNNIIKHNEVSAESSDGVCYGAGITTLYTDTSLIIENNTVAHNKYINGFQCTGGGIFLYYATAKIFNNLIYKNQATHGGGIAISDIDPDKTQIINNTIIGNLAEYGGGIYADQDSVIVVNTIVYGNTATSMGAEIFDYTYTMTISYSDIKNSTPWPGVGNIIEDPLFVDPQNGDFHLTEISPCAGTGIDYLEINGTMYYCPSFDFENDPRPMPFTSMPDMGADEVDESQGIPRFSEDQSSISMNNYPNPFSSTTTIEYNLQKPVIANICIFNHLGQQVESISQGNSQSGKQQYVWNASSLPNGIYVVQVRAGQEMATKKIVKM